MKEMVYLNGTLVPRSEARISVMDYGFLFGYGLYETMRAYNGKVFRLDNHLNRLADSAKTLGIQVEIPTLRKAILDTIQANALTEARVRLTVSLGEGSLTPDPRTCTQPTVLVIAAKYTPHPQEEYRSGVKAIVSSIRRNSQSPIPAHKTTNVLESLLAHQEARTAGVDDAILVNDKGLLAEARSSNVFTVNHGILKTPKPGSGILNGVTRQIVIALAGQLGIRAVETDIELNELRNADEVFLTNAMIEILPLTILDGKPIGDGKPGAITRKLMTAYRDIVLKETG
jgi:branched-chain amino acid aminotransferase